MFPCHNKLSFLFAAPRRHLRYSTASSSEPHFMVPYLIKSLGFTHAGALKASKSLTALRSTHRPDSVICFLKQTGLSDSHIKTFIQWTPVILRYSVDKALQPRIRAIQQEGFSGPLLLQILRTNPKLLALTATLPRLQFWRSFFANDVQELMRAFRRNRQLVTYDLDKKIAPNLALLRHHGFSDSGIAKIITRVNGFVLRSPTAIQELINRTNELGLPFNSGTFSIGLSVVATMKRETLEKKMEFFRCLGWSDATMHSLFRKCPTLFALSEATLRSKICFLLEDAGCDPSYITRCPWLLIFSLEKRLVPRNCVLQVLKSKNVVLELRDFSSIMRLSEATFVQRFILQFKKEVPDLYETYIAACAGKYPLPNPSFMEDKKLISVYLSRLSKAY